MYSSSTGRVSTGDSLDLTDLAAASHSGMEPCSAKSGHRTKNHTVQVGMRLHRFLDHLNTQVDVVVQATVVTISDAGIAADVVLKPRIALLS